MVDAVVDAWSSDVWGHFGIIPLFLEVLPHYPPLLPCFFSLLGDFVHSGQSSWWSFTLHPPIPGYTGLNLYM